jgi:hypothetical protein
MKKLMNRTGERNLDIMNTSWEEAFNSAKSLGLFNSPDVVYISTSELFEEYVKAKNLSILL